MQINKYKNGKRNVSYLFLHLFFYIYFYVKETSLLNLIFLFIIYRLLALPFLLLGYGQKYSYISTWNCPHCIIKKLLMFSLELVLSLSLLAPLVVAVLLKEIPACFTLWVFFQHFWHLNDKFSGCESTNWYLLKFHRSSCVIKKFAFNHMLWGSIPLHGTFGKCLQL